MDAASSTRLGVVLFLFGVLWLGIRGGLRGKVALLILASGLASLDPLIASSLKKVVGRERPFLTFPEIQVRGGRGGQPSFPSSHATNAFFAAAVVAFYYRRAGIPAFGLAAAVGFSRVYNGVHYPLDVAAGAILGCGYAGFLLWGIPAWWSKYGNSWAPILSQRLPDLLHPSETLMVMTEHEKSRPVADSQWLRAGYAIIVGTCLLRWIYLAVGKIELSEDEAYQWLWSKHLALSFYSKPLLIAVSHFLSTGIWGDNAFGIRFFSPLITAAGSFFMMRFLAAEASARAGFWMVAAATATPLLCVGGILMTIDPLSVLFWMAAMVSGWKAWQQDGTAMWAWTGLWMGVGFLSKYTALFQWFSWAVFLGLWPPARRCLRQPGFYVALQIQAICTLPVLLWNSQHGWITVTHIGQRGGLDKHWAFTTRYLLDFLLVEPLVLNPVFFVGMVLAAIGIWRRKERRALEIFLFSMGVPLFLFYFAYTLRARVQPNWIAPAILPLCAMMVVYWEDQCTQGRSWIRRVGKWAVIPVVILLVVAHDTNLVAKASGITLPVRLDPLRRLRAWSEMARIVGEEKGKQERTGGKWFIIGEHYGTTSMISFYLPEAKAAVKGEALVYYQSSPVPLNQFHFWPGYSHRKGQNAIFIQQVEVPGDSPDSIRQEFESVQDLGVRDVLYRGRVIRKIQIFACRNLR